MSENQSFYRTMVEEKGLIHQEFSIENGKDVHIFDVESVITLIENAPAEEQEVIKNTFSQIDFKNGDLLDYIKYLARSYVLTHY